MAASSKAVDDVVDMEVQGVQWLGFSHCRGSQCKHPSEATNAMRFKMLLVSVHLCRSPGTS